MSDNRPHPVVITLRFWLWMGILGTIAVIAGVVIVFHGLLPWQIPIALLFISGFALVFFSSCRLYYLVCPACGKYFTHGLFWRAWFFSGDCVHCGFPSNTIQADLTTGFELAGFCAAHAIAYISENASFVPALVFVTRDGKRVMENLQQDQFGDAIEVGRHRLESNPMNAREAVLLYDGRIPDHDGESRAVILEVRVQPAPDAIMIVVPYTPGSSGRFRVHQPRLLGGESFEDNSRQAFFDGLQQHAKGFAVWKNSSDKASDALLSHASSR